MYKGQPTSHSTLGGSLKHLGILELRHRLAPLDFWRRHHCAGSHCTDIPRTRWPRERPTITRAPGTRVTPSHKHVLKTPASDCPKDGNVTMSDLLDDGLREQLAAALLGWSGAEGQRKSKDTVVEDGGRDTPKAEPSLAQQGYIRGLMQYADEYGTSCDDDIDADSAVDTSDSRSEASRPYSQPRPRSQPKENWLVPQKSLPPLPVEPPLASPQPNMSCRISSFPFTHPIDMPELMPDQDDMFIATPSLPDPGTPGIAPDVFRPLTQISPTPNLDLGPFSPVVSETRLQHRMSRMSISSAGSEADGLGMIREEYDLNDDGVSMMTPTEVSYGGSTGNDSYTDRGVNQGYLTVGRHPPTRSVSSLGSSGSSTEWRPSNASSGRKSSNLFSRIRNSSRPPAEEEFIEKRSLTPLQLSTPPRGVYSDDLLTPTGPPPSVSSSTNNSRSDGNTASRFFNRMPWLGETQPKKPEAVFGTDLKESIRIAPMKSRISHRGKSTSYRTFPLSVYKCSEYIRRAGKFLSLIYNLRFLY